MARWRGTRANRTREGAPCGTPGTHQAPQPHFVHPAKQPPRPHTSLTSFFLAAVSSEMRSSIPRKSRAASLPLSRALASSSSCCSTPCTLPNNASCTAPPPPAHTQATPRTRRGAMWVWSRQRCPPLAGAGRQAASPRTHARTFSGSSCLARCCSSLRRSCSSATCLDSWPISRSSVPLEAAPTSQHRARRGVTDCSGGVRWEARGGGRTLAEVGLDGFLQALEADGDRTRSSGDHVAHRREARAQRILACAPPSIPNQHPAASTGHGAPQGTAW